MRWVPFLFVLALAACGADGEPEPFALPQSTAGATVSVDGPY